MVLFRSHCLSCTCVNIKWSKYKSSKKTNNRKGKAQLKDYQKQQWTLWFLVLWCSSFLRFFFSFLMQPRFFFSNVHSLLLYSLIHFFFLFGIVCSNRIKKAEKFAKKKCKQTFIRYCIQSVSAYILSMCACVRIKIERALRKGCSFYFLFISLISHWRSFTHINISSKYE